MNGPRTVTEAAKVSAERIPVTVRPLSTGESHYLNCVRFLAAEAVMLGHVSKGFLAEPFIGGTIVIQTAAVSLFFFISGLLICYDLLRNFEQVDYGFVHYVIDRATRIFVPLIPILCIVYMSDRIFVPDYPNSEWRNLLYSLVLIDDNAKFQYYFHTVLHQIGLGAWAPPEVVERLGSIRPLWSINLEWWFYMAFGLFFFAVTRGPSVWMLVVGVPVAVLAYNDHFVTWIMGAAFAYLYLSGSLRLSRTWALRAALAAASLLLIVEGMVFGFRFTGELTKLLIGVLAGCSLFLCKEFVWPQRLSRLIAFGAAYSYTLYLTHYPVMVYLKHGLGDGVLSFCVALILTNIVAIVLYFLFERNYKLVRRLLKQALGMSPSLQQCGAASRMPGLFNRKV